MTWYRAEIRKTMVFNVDFNGDEIENEDDPEVAAWEIACAYPEGEWEIEHTEVDVERMDGELPTIS